MVSTDCQELGRITFLGRFKKRRFKKELCEWTHSARIFLSHRNDDQRASTREEAFYKQLFVESLSHINPCFLIGFMNKVTMEIRMEVKHGFICENVKFLYPIGQGKKAESNRV